MRYGLIGMLGLFAAAGSVGARPAAAQAAMAIPMDVPTKASDIRPLLVGSDVPDVTVTDIDGDSVRLADAISKKPTVLIFYRGGWCPFCNAQMAQLEKIQPDLTHMGYQILAVGADRPEELKKSLNKHHLTYSL